MNSQIAESRPQVVHKPRILLVEDEPTSRAILSEYLTSAGYGVDEAEDGQLAWNILLDNQMYDLIVTDRHMPNMDGLELAVRIKAENKLRHIPVIMQTGATAPEDVLQGIRAGVFYYLTKPYEEASLLSVMRAALGERQRTEIFERRLASQRHALDTLMTAEFHVKTPDDAQNVALMLGGIFPRAEAAAAGLYELLLNGIEHGNLGIGYEMKNKLLSENGWQQEVKRRLDMPDNRDKKVTVQLNRTPQQIDIVITDQGTGFDYRPFLEIEPSRATQGSGRGIAKANLLSFDQMKFEGAGNQVRIQSRLSLG